MVSTLPKKSTAAQLKVSDSIKSAIDIMKAKGVTQLPVFDGQNFFGLLDVVDLLSVLANGKLRADEAVFHVVKMSTPEVDGKTTLDQLQSVLNRESAVRVRGSGDLVTRADLTEYIGGMKE
jgi:predicted transcriptional regulator